MGVSGVADFGRVSRFTLLNKLCGHPTFALAIVNIHMDLSFISYLIVILGAASLLRMAIFLIGSDLYELNSHLNKKRKLVQLNAPGCPAFTVIIPAYNESNSVVRAMDSVYSSRYPKEKVRIVMVDDGSTDSTYRLAKNYAAGHTDMDIVVVSKKNGGKAEALNYGAKNFALGELIMCLDADSYLAPDALTKSAVHFEDKSVVAMAANVKIIKRKGLLNLVQLFEYALSYQMKRAESLFNVEYIVGGIGSVFRKSILKKVGYYDTNTVTEDIDLTLKILRLGNKTYRASYGADVVAYTEAVLSIPALIRQRFRWKYGRCQSFLKNRTMFFNSGREFTKGLTWFYLPLAIVGDIIFSLEPLLVGYIWYISITYLDFITIGSACLVTTVYVIFNVVSENTSTTKDKIKMTLTSPFVYLLFYFLSLVEYVALAQSVIKLPHLAQSLKSGKSSWKPVERPQINWTT